MREGNIKEQLFSRLIFTFFALTASLKGHIVFSPASTALTYSRMIFTRLWSIFIALCWAIRCSATNREDRENAGVKTYSDSSYFFKDV